MVSDLRREKSQPKETGFILQDDDGNTYPLYEINTIGRAEDADIIIHDPFISSKHALIFKRGSRLMIQDLHSTNGTYLNNKKITRPLRLKENDEITLGTKKFKFLRSETVGAKDRSYLQ